MTTIVPLALAPASCSAAAQAGPAAGAAAAGSLAQAAHRLPASLAAAHDARSRLLLRRLQAAAEVEAHAEPQQPGAPPSGAAAPQTSSQHPPHSPPAAAVSLSQLLHLWFHKNTTLARQWPEQRKACHPDCSQRGNCNHIAPAAYRTATNASLFKREARAYACRKPRLLRVL
jgi:hypothetical protein